MHPAYFKLLWFSIVAFLCNVSFALEDSIDFNKHIRPLLAKHCYACHGADTAESNLRLDLRDSATAESDSGARAIVPGKSDDSELIRRITSQDDSDRMPPEGEPLSPESIELLKKWIDEGAEYRKHWAFQTIQQVDVPTTSNKSWSLNPIDAFILHRLEKSNLHPNSEADARSLLRRIYYNTIGLPPSHEELTSFEQQMAASSNRSFVYEEKVDELLSDPRFGERWARHWLDVVRYAETNSFERDGDKPNAWRYRDYVVSAFNSDKPYDRFLKEQLAGDELEDASNETHIATGYYRLEFGMTNQLIPCKQNLMATMIWFQ